MQCVGSMRQDMPEGMEREANKCNSMTDLRKIAENKPEFVAASSDSIYLVKMLFELCPSYARSKIKENPSCQFSNTS